jgi:hypothetical protein
MGLAVGCQSPSMKALSRWKASEKDSAQPVADKADPATRGAGLPQPTQKQGTAGGSPRAAYDAGVVALNDHYHAPNPARLDEARRQFELAARTDPSFAPAQHRLGIVADLQAQMATDANRPHEAAQLFDAAQSHYLTAMSLDQANANIPADLGYSSILQGRWMAAEQYLSQALQMDPRHDKAVKHLAYVYGRQGQLPLAEETLSRVMSPEEARHELVGMFPDAGSQAPGGNFDRLKIRNGAQNAQPDGLMAGVHPADLEATDPRRQLQAAQQTSFAQQGYGGGNLPNTATGSWPPPNGQAAMGEGDSLRHQLAAVDRAGRPNPNVPLVVGQPNGAVPSALPATAGSNGQLATANSPYYADEPSGRVDPPPTITPQSRSSQNLAPVFAGGREMNPLRSREEHAAATQANAQQPNVPEDPRVNPLAAGQAIPAAGLAARQNPLLASTSPPNIIISPMGTSGNTVPVDFSSNQAAVSAVPAAQQMPEAAGNVQPASEVSQATFEQARRSAALMGLGVGPGQMFSTLEHQANRIAAGSNSQFNGTSFPQPPRDLPDMRTPPDLRQSPSFFQPAEAAPPPNNLGQQMPAAAPNLSTPPQWPAGPAGPPLGSAVPPAGPVESPVTHAQWAGEPAANELARYDETRGRVDQTLQHSMSAWANSPAQGIPSPSSGVPFRQPPPPAQQMEAWNRPPVSPEPYPNAAQPRTGSLNVETITLPSVTPVSGRMPSDEAARYVPATSRSVAPTYRDGVVVPEQYRRYR